MADSVNSIAADPPGVTSDPSVSTTIPPDLTVTPVPEITSLAPSVDSSPAIDSPALSVPPSSTPSALVDSATSSDLPTTDLDTLSTSISAIVASTTAVSFLPISDNNIDQSFTQGMDGVNLSLDKAFTVALWTTIVVLIVIISVVCYAQIINARRRRRDIISHGEDEATMIRWQTDKTWLWPRIKSHLIYAPLFRKRHNREIQITPYCASGTVPSRLHTIILAIYLLSNIVYCLSLSYTKSPKAAILAELRGRSGHLAVVNMVPLVVLAGRNNPFIWLLNIPFDTYNLFHRWIGRLVVLQILLHTLAWAVNEHDLKGAAEASQHLANSTSLQFGLLGTIAVSLTLLQSPSFLRHAFYETFLHCHQLLALCTIIGAWIHCTVGKLAGTPYVYAAFALWMLDRLARLARIIYLSFPTHGPMTMTQITVEALSTTDDSSSQACRISVQLARPFQYRPGMHCYLYLPSISMWMNHPFSIAWSSDQDAVSEVTESSFKTSPLLDWRPQEKSISVCTSTTQLNRSIYSDEQTICASPSLLASPFPEPEPSASPLASTISTTLHFIVARRGGMTAKLYDRANASPSRKMIVKGLMEGPYGGHGLGPFKSYGTVILFAAGVGITHQIGHVRTLLESAITRSSCTRRITLIWSVRDPAALEWVRPWIDELLDMADVADMAGGHGRDGHKYQRRQILKVLLFVTRPIAQPTPLLSTAAAGAGVGDQGVGQHRPSTSRSKRGDGEGTEENTPKLTLTLVPTLTLTLENENENGDRIENEEKQVNDTEKLDIGNKIENADFNTDPNTFSKSIHSQSHSHSHSHSISHSAVANTSHLSPPKSNIEKNNSNSGNQNSSKSKSTMTSNSMVNIHTGRCDPSEIIATEMEERFGSVAISCCGPGSFADEVRLAVRCQGIPNGTCDFVEEAFTW